MNDIKPLYTPADYEGALKEIETYFKDIPVPGTDAADRFNALSGLIEKFEETTAQMTRALFRTPICGEAVDCTRLLTYWLRQDHDDSHFAFQNV